MLEPKIKIALAELLDNPFQKTKDLLPDFEDRRKLYSLPAFDIIVKARREGKKASARVKIRLKKDASLRALAREKKRIERKIENLPPEEKIPVKVEHVVNADKRQGDKSTSHHDAEMQALSNDERYVCLVHNLEVVKDSIFEKCRQEITGVMETIPSYYRYLAAGFVRKRFGYAPGKKVREIPQGEDKKRFREINLFADCDYIQDKSKIEELMQPESQSQGEARGWSKLSQAGFINPETGRLECSFA